MDTPRRWQIASLTTAVVSLGVGGLVLGRSPTEPVDAIELEGPPPVAVLAEVETRPDDEAVELVTPGVVEVSPSSASSPSPSTASADSVVSVESPDSPSSPDTPSSPDSPDSPSSVDSPS